MEANPEEQNLAQNPVARNLDLTEEINRTEEELRNILSRQVVVI